MSRPSEDARIRLPECRRRDCCRACGGARLRLFLSLGPMPLANSFLRSRAEFADERSYPLDVYFCEDCALVQLLDVIDPEVLFRNYVYVTGISDTIRRHNIQYAKTVARLLNLGPEDLVVEVASNDGSLLKCFQPYRARTLGIEPAVNIAKRARADGVTTLNRFFDASTAREVRETYGPAKAVIGNNVLAHVDDTRDFLAGCRDLLTDGGLVILEVPYLPDLIGHLEYDTIYHEHLCYFSAGALLRMCDSVGLSAVRMDRISIHGGSLRVYAGRADCRGGHSVQAMDLAAWERSRGFAEFALYEQFAARVRDNRKQLLECIGALSAGDTLAGYGAPAKGNILLNYCGIGTDLLAFTVDKNPLKVGLYTPGMHIPVLPVSALLERRAGHVLILAWNFAEEVMEQQEEFRRGGGRFVIPFPELKVV